MDIGASVAAAALTVTLESTIWDMLEKKTISDFFKISPSGKNWNLISVQKQINFDFWQIFEGNARLIEC